MDCVVELCISKQGTRYIKTRMGNDLKRQILVQNGIMGEQEIQKKPSILNCPHCTLVNAIDNKYCSKCSYPLVSSAFDEIKEAELFTIHSLGARVILSSLDSLHKDPLWIRSCFKIASVHLLGAAVHNEEVSNDPQDILSDQTYWGTVKSDYGESIEKEDVNFYNLYNPKDKVLGPNSINPFLPFQIYPSFEGDLAVGQNGSQTSPKISLPTNYVDIKVQKEIPFNKDADGDKHSEDLRLTLKPVKRTCMITGGGDSDFGYFGFRDAAHNTELKDDGAMNIVVDNWRNTTS
jgi:hypothetical protein